MNDQNKELKDLLTDEWFRDLVLKKDRDKSAAVAWDKLLQQTPLKREILKDAASVILSFKKLDVPVHASGRRRVWHQIDRQIQTRRSIRNSFNQSFLKVAALILLVFSPGLFFIIKKATDTAVVSTAYGSRETVILPDSSEVRLGANSVLKYGKNWTSGKPREVWIEGEAGLVVKHINRDKGRIHPGERFLVHLGRNVVVEVLGTSFRVKNRRGKTDVYLLSGEVSVTDNGRVKHLARAGEHVSIAAPGGRMVSEVRESVVQQGKAWERGYILLENVAVSEVAGMIQETYGKRLVIDDPALLSRRLDGGIPAANENEAVRALESILHAKITFRGNELIVTPVAEP